MAWRPGRGLVVTGAVLLVGVILARAAVGLYTEVLWYRGLGYAGLYWARLGIALVVQLVAGVLAGLVVLANLWLVARQVGSVHVRRRYGNLEIAEKIPSRYVAGGVLVTAALAGWWLSSLQFGGTASLSVYAWLRSVAWGTTEPVFGRDLSFFVFSYPAYRRLADFLLLALVWSAVLVGAGYVLVGAIRLRGNRLDLDPGARQHAVGLLVALLVLLALRFWLGRYELLLEGEGIGGSLGYTDVRARLPAQAVLAGLCLFTAGAVVAGAWRRSWLGPAVAGGILLAGMLVLGYLVPSAVQKFQVEPNELAREAPFIRWNIEFTRLAYGLGDLERRAFPYARVPPPTWDEAEPVLGAAPLWDREPLRVAFNQRQSLIGYYRFQDVDFDRYGPPGRQEQVGIAVREFYPAGLQEASRTWQSLRLNPRYVRGMGAVAARVASAGGEPDFLLYDLAGDSVSLAPTAPQGLALTQPSVFVGEETRDYVLLVPGREGALTGQPGRDHPEGVELSSFWRVLAYAWRFGDKNLLFSGEITDDSRILFRRSVDERLRALAPFLLWGPDPVPVVHRGRIVWLADGYSASGSFPLAQPYSPPGVPWSVRYLRHSVKAVVDAVTGDVDFYALENPDPVLETYRRVFPGLIRPLSELPQELAAHLRYPILFLEAQARILETYHLETPEAFYAGQDVWQIPREAPTEGSDQPFRADYALLPLPGATGREFLILVPFVARERQNMTAVLIGRNDPPHFGELILLELPRDQLVPGPTQVRAQIEQDPVISAQLTLWSQRGSSVDFGHMLIVPTDSAFLYIQPIFLSAADQSIPELQQVVVSDGRRVAMAPRLAVAIDALAAGEARPEPGRQVEESLPVVPQGAWSVDALDLLLEAEARARAGDWAAFGERLAELRRLLERAARETP